MARGVMIRCTNARFLELLAEGDSAGVGVLTCATQPSRGCIRDGRFFFSFFHGSPRRPLLGQATKMDRRRVQYRRSWAMFDLFILLGPGFVDVAGRSRD